MEKVAMFIDANNMFFAQKDIGWQIDWELVLQYFTNNKKLYGAYYITAKPSAENFLAFKKYRGFKNFLIHTGFKVIDKEVRTIKDFKTGRIKVKGNLDVELVFCMMLAADQWDEGIVFSCDIDYSVIIQHFINTGKRMKIVGCRNMTSLDLINVASEYIELNEIRSDIERNGKK